MAAVTASIPMMAAVREPKLAQVTAPTIVIPEIALAPDISGVCSVCGTFVSSSRPTKIASTKT